MTGFFRSPDCMIQPIGCGAEQELFRQLEVIAIFGWLLLLVLIAKRLARSFFPANRKNKAQV